jgi:PST family polysaccharide transporter
MSLKKKTISGLIWSFISQGGKQVIQLVIIAILARFLSPEDFGLMAMITVVTNFALIFNEMCFSSALIQKQDTTEDHFYSAFWLNIIVGVALSVIFFVSSPAIAWFYKRPELMPLLMVVSVNFILSSLVIVQQTLLTKEMDFKKLAIRDIVAVILSGIVGIYLAYHGFGIWSLVWQFLLMTFFNVILLWSVSPWRPKFRFSTQCVKDIFRFSLHLTGFKIINYLARNIDQLLIGSLLGAGPLGYYSLAAKVMLLPTAQISTVISRVTFPAFSMMQSNYDKIQRAYFRMIQAISIITFPFMCCIAILAHPLVLVFLGKRWLPAAPLIQILCLAGLSRSVGGSVVGDIRLSQGKSDLHLRLGILNAVFLIASVFVGLRWGLIGIVTAIALFQMVWCYYTNAVTLPLIKLTTKTFFKAIRSGVILSVFLGIFVFILKNITNLNNFQNLLMSLVAFILFYILLLVRKGILVIKKKEFKVVI